jgi:hypothetical protein
MCYDYCSGWLMGLKEQKAGQKPRDQIGLIAFCKEAKNCKQSKQGN